MGGRDGENQSRHSGDQKQAAPGQSTHYYFRALEDLFGKENVFLFFFAWFAYFVLILYMETFFQASPRAKDFPEQIQRAGGCRHAPFIF